MIVFRRDANLTTWKAYWISNNIEFEETFLPCSSSSWLGCFMMVTPADVLVRLVGTTVGPPRLWWKRWASGTPPAAFTASSMYSCHLGVGSSKLLWTGKMNVWISSVPWKHILAINYSWNIKTHRPFTMIVLVTKHAIMHSRLGCPPFPFIHRLGIELEEAAPRGRGFVFPIVFVVGIDDDQEESALFGCDLAEMHVFHANDRRVYLRQVSMAPEDVFLILLLEDERGGGKVRELRTGLMT